MEIIFINLIVESIGFARDILAYFTQKNESQENTPILINYEENILEKSGLNKIIKETNEYYSNILDIHTNKIIDELKKQNITNAIQMIQAHVKVIEQHLEAKEIDPDITRQLMVNILNPLAISIEVANSRLVDYGDTQTALLCSLIGKSSLFSIYNYLDQDAIYLRNEIQNLLYNIQKNVLDVTANNLIKQNMLIPWDRVSTLLAPEGTEELLKIYESTISKEIDDEIDVSILTIKELRVLLEQVDNKEYITWLITQEEEGKARIGALDILRAKRMKMDNEEE